MSTSVELTDEEMVVAIAETCGLTGVHKVTVDNVQFQGDTRHIGITSDQGWIPDYLNSLDAMHEAEKVLTEEQFETYAFWIAHVTPLGKQIVATARQRAEAFLRVVRPDLF